MIAPRMIERALDTIVAQCDPEQIFLIGSHATGTAKAGSDLDLIIVQHSAEDKHARDQRIEQLLAPLLIPVDINVYTPAEFDEEVHQPWSFARLATRLQGKLVYSREHGDFAALQSRWDREPTGARHARLCAALGASFTDGAASRSATAAEWQLYQTQYARAARAFPEPAWAFAAAVLTGAPSAASVADLGCGERALARHLAAVGGPAVTSFDHCAIDEHVITADLAAVPVAGGAFDFAVLALALLGSNWATVLAEATRVAAGGRLLLTELAAGPRALADITAALTELGLRDVTGSTRGPFYDLDVRLPAARPS